MKIRQVGAELFHADGRTDGRTDMMELIIVSDHAAGPSRLDGTTTERYETSERYPKYLQLVYIRS